MIPFTFLIGLNLFRTFIIQGTWVSPRLLEDVSWWGYWEGWIFSEKKPFEAWHHYYWPCSWISSFPQEKLSLSFFSNLIVFLVLQIVFEIDGIPRAQLLRFDLFRRGYKILLYSIELHPNWQWPIQKLQLSGSWRTLQGV